MTKLFNYIFKNKFNINNNYDILPDDQYVVKYHQEKYLYNCYIIIEYIIIYGEYKNILIPFYSDNKIAKKITKSYETNFAQLMSKHGDVHAESLYSQMTISNDGLILVNYRDGTINDAVPSDYNNDSVYRFLQKRGFISLDEMRNKLK